MPEDKVVLVGRGGVNLSFCRIQVPKAVGKALDRIDGVVVIPCGMCPQGMVCFLEENFAHCIVRDQTGNAQEKITFDIPSSSTVQQLFQEVGKRLQYHHESFELILNVSKDGETVVLNDKKLETVENAGLKCGDGSKNSLILLPIKGIPVQKTNVSDEDSQMESVTSPTAYGDYEAPPAPPPLPPPPPASTSSSGDYTYSLSIMRQDSNKSSGSRYVGLVNQAMTCYLNSLLQALFMTPEFRNALYNWEFDESQSDEFKSIPYQLQKLFLNLQTSPKSAVETTELTRSFGWDSSEAWQQHDIQELCRVMFDALEQKFKNTEQADLINRLYEGKMIDYVKCLECSTEKSREDTFLDIPLPVRPFGSTVAYGSVEEALRAFVQPETLEGNNQYHCETCNKKCDAHKGLKFSKFPYLLTLHLKRFDFDYSTLHRIKLNDKVSFPEKLNLNSFVAHIKGEEANSESTPEEVIVKCDDSSTTDSGSALDDEGCQGIETVSVPNSNENHNADYQEDDEGIDVSQMNEMEKNRQNLSSESGPYIYELFSIMIHSGSAAGGHYYAYIKDFKDGEWYCFNDQNVTKITHEDIRKTYGGGPIRGYYSGAYSSSTNAYMLMYRQVDQERNTNAMSVDEFPPHIKKLHKKLEEQKEMESRMREKKLDLCKVKVYCHNPTQTGISETKLYLRDECTLKEATEEAYRKLSLEKIVPIERCRLVSYDRSKELIECSFEGRDEDTIKEVFQNHKNEFLLEIRKEDEEFEVYKPGNINTKVLLVNLETEEVKGPIIVRGNLSETVREYKETLLKQLKLPGDSIHIVLEKYNSDPRLLESDEATLKYEGFYGSSKIYVATALDDEDAKKPLISSKLHRIIDRFEYVITLHVALPNVDNETLEKLNIPPLDHSQSSSGNRQNEDVLMTSHSRGASPNERDPSPQPLPDPEDECLGPAGPYSDQSASEDSSLTDSERTIVGEAPGDCLAQLSPSNSPVGSDQNVSSPENDSEFTTKERFKLPINNGKTSFGLAKRRRERRFANTTAQKDEDSNWDGNWDPECSATSASRGRISNYDCDDTTTRLSFNCYFKATPYTDGATNQKMLKILVDKRMIQKTLKQFLEPYVGVSVDHFKLYRSYNGSSDIEFSRPAESLTIFRDDEKLTVKLGRALKKGETVGNVFLLAPNSSEPVKFLCEWIIANGSSVGQVKKEILEEIKRKCAIDIPYNRCRLRKKNWKNPTRPYLDDQVFEDFISNWELFVQELPEEEPVTSTNQKLIFVRQWCPATLELKPFQEVVLDSNLVSECKLKISQLSDIPIENVDIAKGQGSFPCNDVSVLGIHSDLDWNPSTLVLDGWPLNIYDDGHVIFYRDNREKIKHLSIDERKEIISKESRKLGNTSTSVFSYSPRKEKALKIYLDSTPPGDKRRENRNESDVD